MYAFQAGEWCCKEYASSGWLLAVLLMSHHLEYDFKLPMLSALRVWCSKFEYLVCVKLGCTQPSTN